MIYAAGMRTDEVTEPGLRERKRLTTRQALGQAALRLAVERGPADVRREDIAAAANVSPRTFSNYFSSKEEAIVSLAVDRAAGVTASLRGRPVRESLRTALVAAFVEQYAQAAPSREWVRQIRVIVSSPEVQGAYLKILATIEVSLADAIADRIGADAQHELRPRVLAAAACGAERVAIGYWLDVDASVPLADLVRQAITQVVR
ncbi:MAG: hypothetical protein V7637_2700 [Mycobacteriales bacterium]|jgi:AcrR family transcriptional regulator